MQAEGPVDKEGGPDQGFFCHGTEVAAVETGHGIVAEGQKLCLWSQGLFGNICFRTWN